ncbi:polysaccharide deacetylase family protein [Thalassospira sp.]|uniref:polysaccharide deacetylase family protein n=1 Tax=Thalassospira sp. TaxID=1912094 RepID=UPI0032F0689B
MIDKLTGLILRSALRINPPLYKSRLARWAEENDLQRPAVVLSFDCDTDRDAKAALSLQTIFFKAGIPALYAVPGELLRDHWSIYQQLPRLGGRFINHGFRRHAAVDPDTGRVYSTLSYKGLSENAWREDIRKGHENIMELTGEVPTIFRTPHFGEFCQPKQLKLLYDWLSKLGYTYSSSVTPRFAAHHGSQYEPTNGLIETPLSGCLAKPAQLIDSWGFVSAPDALGVEQLVQALQQYLDLFECETPLLLNIYFDPADIVGETQVIDLLVSFASWAQPDYQAVTVGLTERSLVEVKRA